MSRFGKAIKRVAKKVGGAVKKYDPMAKQMGFGGDDKANDPAAPDKGPQFTDAARSQAAGAGTVGFTQRTQNW